MGLSNVTIDTVDLDNGAWRRITSQPLKQTVNAGGLDQFFVEFVVEGSTSDELTDRIIQTEADFTKESARITAKIDDASAKTYLDWSPGDGVHSTTYSAVSLSDDAVHTKFSAHMSLAVFAERILPAGVGGGTGGGSAFEFDGQTTNIEIGIDRDASRRIVRNITGVFVATYDQDANGPFALSSVTDDGSGNADFTLVGTMPTFKDGMKLEASGSTLHDGIHVVTGIVGQVVSTTQPFLGADTPVSATAKIGETTTALENYNAARSTLLTDYLLVNSDGSRNTTSGLVLIKEQTGDTSSDAQLEFILVANSQRFELITATNGSANVVRGIQAAYNWSQPSDWDRRAGTRPTDVTIRGTATIDRVEANTSLSALYFGGIEDELIARAKSILNNNNSSAVLKRNLDFDDDTNVISFQIVVRVDWSGVFSLSYRQGTTETQVYSEWTDSNGDSVVQLRPGPADKIATVTVERIADNRTATSQLEVPPLPESGMVWQKISESFTENFKEDSDFGPSYRQTGEFIYKRRRYAAGAGAKFVGPTVGTGRGFRSPLTGK